MSSLVLSRVECFEPTEFNFAAQLLVFVNGSFYRLFFCSIHKQCLFIAFFMPISFIALKWNRADICSCNQFETPLNVSLSIDSIDPCLWCVAINCFYLFGSISLNLLMNSMWFFLWTRCFYFFIELPARFNLICQKRKQSKQLNSWIEIFLGRSSACHCE